MSAEEVLLFWNLVGSRCGDLLFRVGTRSMVEERECLCVVGFGHFVTEIEWMLFIPFASEEKFTIYARLKQIS